MILFLFGAFFGGVAAVFLVGWFVWFSIKPPEENE